VAFWPSTTDNAVASYRIRCAQIRRGLAERGIETTLFRAGSGMIARLRPTGAAPDILILSKRTKEAAFELADDLKRKHGTRTVLDLCDNLFFSADPAEAAGRAVRLGSRLNGFDAIVTPSAYLRDAIAAHVRPDMTFVIIPDAVEQEPQASLGVRLREAPAFRRLSALRAELARSGVSEGRRLVWYGISGTKKARNGLYDVDAHAAVLERHHRRRPLSLTVVTDSRRRYDETLAGRSFPTFFVRWNYWTFNACLRLHDIAVLPVQRNEYNWAKSANRLTTALANGLAVCATAIPSYEPFRGSAVLDDWEDGLADLMASEAGRRARIEAGRAVIDTEYTLQAATRKWADLLGQLSRSPVGG
jgi:hypothetical protein